MKLIKLKINDGRGFRSLKKGFEINFQDDSDDSESNDFYPYVLAGQNGSGKSNVLEALAEIFYHLDCIYTSYKPDYFNKSDDNPKGFDSTFSRIDEYELEFYTFLETDIFLLDSEEIKNAHINIKKIKGQRPKISWLNEIEFRKITELSQQESKSLLPKYVVGYASGNNETLSFPFIKSRFLQFDEYLSNLASKEFVSPRPESSLIYLDEAYSQAILLSNFLMLDHVDGDKEEIDLLTPLKKYVGVKDIDSFRLIIRSDIEIIPPQSSNVKDEDVKKTRLLQNLDFKKILVEKELAKKHNATSYIEKLKSCATTWYDNYLMDLDDKTLEEDYNKSYLYLDFKVDDETKKAFQFHFDKDPLNLFELFQMLLLQDLYKVPECAKKNIYTTQNVFLNQDIGYLPDEINRIFRFKYLKIKKNNVEETIYTKELSDGEHQLLHTLGLCILYRKERCLFLFDEPETHFNPDWKAQYLTSVRKCFNDINAEAEMLITTHSPYLISDSDKKHVRIFKKILNENSRIVCNSPQFQTLGSSINKITIEIFGADITIGDYALSKLDKIDERFKLGENVEMLLGELDEQLGDSVEKTLLKHTLLK